MSHGEAYREGKISLKQYRHLQGLKLAGMRAKNPARWKAILREYKLQERLLHI
ncbi:MAG TPA: hypothetical protein VEP90_03550 [Methylomirabilota bacterium]|nr:hypothetical protein [Methylomirabilota bacterium]